MLYHHHCQRLEGIKLGTENNHNEHTYTIEEEFSSDSDWFKNTKVWLQLNINENIINSIIKMIYIKLNNQTRRSVEHCTPHADGAWLNELGWSQ